jgi:hypothetical protein
LRQLMICDRYKHKEQKREGENFAKFHCDLQVVDRLWKTVSRRAGRAFQQYLQNRAAYSGTTSAVVKVFLEIFAAATVQLFAVVYSEGCARESASGTAFSGSLRLPAGSGGGCPMIPPYYLATMWF